MNGEFLLDTRRGRVWKYDNIKNVFVRINKESTIMEKAVLGSYLHKVKMNFETDFKALSGAEQKKVKEVFDMNNKVLIKKIEHILLIKQL